MTFATHGGPAGSGTKFPGLKEKPGPWQCACGETHPGYLARCWTSDELRPDLRKAPE